MMGEDEGPIYWTIRTGDTRTGRIRSMKTTIKGKISVYGDDIWVNHQKLADLINEDFQNQEVVITIEVEEHQHVWVMKHEGLSMSRLECCKCGVRGKIVEDTDEKIDDEH